MEVSDNGLFQGAVPAFAWREWGKPQRNMSGQLVSCLVQMLQIHITDLYSFTVHFHMSVKFLPTYALLLW